MQGRLEGPCQAQDGAPCLLRKSAVFVLFLHWSDTSCSRCQQLRDFTHPPEAAPCLTGGQRCCRGKAEHWHFLLQKREEEVWSLEEELLGPPDAQDSLSCCLTNWSKLLSATPRKESLPLKEPCSFMEVLLPSCFSTVDHESSRRFPEEVLPIPFFEKTLALHQFSVAPLTAPARICWKGTIM